MDFFPDLLLISFVLAGAARQPLFSVILFWSIYLCSFVCRFLLLQTAGQLTEAWRSISTHSVWPELYKI